MRGVINSLRSGDWLTRERMRLVAFAVLFASVVGLLAIVARSDGYLDSRGHPIGTDFANVYAAGTYVLEGRAAAPFDPATHHARQQEIFGANTPFYGWHYPPFFLFIAAALALLPYGARAGGLGHDDLPALSRSRSARSCACANRRRTLARTRAPSTRCGCCSRPRFRRCWSMPVTARTASSPPR